MDAVTQLRLLTKQKLKVGKIFYTMLWRTQIDQIWGKSFKVWTVPQILIHQTKPCLTTVATLAASKPKLTFLCITIPGSASSTCQKQIVISTVTSKNNSTLHQLTMKVVFHFKCVSRWLPLNRWRVKEQWALTTFLHLFLNHLVFWPSRNYYPYLIHLSVLLTPQESGGLPSSFHYWKLRNHQVKFHLPARKNSCWSSLLHRRDESVVQLIPSWVP